MASGGGLVGGKLHCRKVVRRVASLPAAAQPQAWNCQVCQSEDIARQPGPSDLSTLHDRRRTRLARRGGRCSEQVEPRVVPSEDCCRGSGGSLRNPGWRGDYAACVGSTQKTILNINDGRLRRQGPDLGENESGWTTTPRHSERRRQHKVPDRLPLASKSRWFHKRQVPERTVCQVWRYNYLEPSPVTLMSAPPGIWSWGQPERAPQLTTIPVP